MRRRVRTLCLAALLMAAVPALAGPSAPVVERVVTVDIDRSVRNAFGIHTDGDEIVIHLHSTGNGGERLIDARTGRPWAGSREQFSQMRRVYDFDVAGEPPDSYLLALGCGQWRTCTTLEDAEFVVMARQGERADQLAFRTLDFRGVLETTERALRGEANLDEAMLTRDARIALSEAGSHGWRTRLIDALRSVRSVDALARIDASSGIRAMRSMPFFAARDAAWVSLERELDLARCRVRMQVETNGLIDERRPISGGYAEALHACNGYFSHLIDWALELNAERRGLLAGRLQAEGARTRNEDALRLAHYIATPADAARPVPDPAASPGQAGRVSKPQVAATPKPKAPVAPKAGQAVSVSPQAVPERADENPDAEWVQVRALPNKLQLLAFNETSGITRVDPTSVAGTVFVAKVLGSISEGRFQIEAFNRGGAPVKLKRGAYRVKVQAVLNWTREDDCAGLQCLFSGKKIIAAGDQRVVEFQLIQRFGFKDIRKVSFGQLLPSDLEKTGKIVRTLKEVRLSLNFIDITPL